ncbi:MAG: hypothetical protein U5L00_01580 [Desulfovermiculus sp.]|nr:hypothetical protein [Desulfovermiculus sp.]
MEFRKHSNLRVRAQHRIRATVLEHIERWLELIDLCPAISIQEFAVPALLDEVGVIQSENDIETLAQALRQSWRLGLNPIPDLVSVLEENGILVIFVHEDDPQFSGLSALANGIPVVVVGSQWPGDRQRFTCKIITSRELQNTFQLFSQKGWRSQEPGDPVDQETTQRFEQLVLRGLAEGYFNESKAAELLNISISAFHRERNLEPAA